MSNRAILKADLLKLLPSYDESRLPPDLIALAETFATQANQLSIHTSEKPASLFLCAHLACEQLSTKLTLPNLDTTSAPLPPSKYKVLFQRIRTETLSKQSQDSGHSRLTTRRNTSRTQMRELCSKFTSVPVSHVVRVLDHLVPDFRRDDTRALVAAVYLLAHQSIKKEDTVSGTIMSAVTKELGLRKGEVESEVDYVRGKSRGTDLFEFSKVRKLEIEGASGTKKRAKIAQVRMMQFAIDFTSERYQEDFSRWKQQALATLQERIRELSRRSDAAEPVVMTSSVQ